MLTATISVLKRHVKQGNYESSQTRNYNEVVRLDWYKCELLFRTDKKGGGVALYIRNTIFNDMIPEYTIVNPNFESLLVKTRQFIVRII